MKRLFSIILGVLTLLSASVFTGCVEDIVDINDELTLGRCLTPTDLSAKVLNGEFIEFSWNKSKGATAFVLELYSDEAMEQKIDAVTVPVDNIPYTWDLEADMIYYARVKAIDESETGLEDSHWAVFEDELQTYAIKSSLNPQFVSSTLNSITLKWTADPEVDHVRITPAVSNEDGKYSRFDVPEEAVEAAQVTVTGLNPSVKYTLAVHFKSADRGQVVAWTQPDTENAVRVTSIAEFKEKYANGQSKFVFAYSETPYEYGEFKAADFTHDLEIYGEPSSEGEFPTLLMNTKPSATVKKMHFERMHICGAPGATVGASNYFVNVQNVGQDIESITFLNCKISEFERALYYDNNNGKLGSLVIKECEINTIKQSFIDSRQKGSSVFGSLLIENSTIQNVGYAFLRFAAGVTPSITVKNNTIYNCGYDSAHNLGFISVAENIETFIMESNLIMGMTDASGSNKNQLFVTTKAKTMKNNFFYDCYEDFIGDDDAVTYATAGGGAVLKDNPVVDAVGGVFNVTDASVKAAGAGDPRWLVTYVEVPEDLTQTVTPTVTTWDLEDAKTFRGKADKDMVRGNIRFYVQNTPFNLGGGKIEFTGKSTVDESGVPTDAGMGIKVNQPGSIVVSTAASELAGTHSHLTISLNGEVSASVPVGAEYQKVTFPGITEESTIYITACDPIAITFLQWTDDVEVINTVLDTPVLKIDKTSVQERADEVVTVSWEAVDYAGAYEVTYNDKTTTVTETSFAIETATISVEEEGGDFKVVVKAVPAKDDYIRTASGTAEVSFHVNDVPVVDTGEIVDPTAITETYFVELNTDGGFASQKFADGNGPVTIDKLTFGDKAEFDGKRYKHGGASALGDDGIPSNRYVSFKITRAGTISHKVISGSGSDATRKYVVALVTSVGGTKTVRELYNDVAPTSSDAEAKTTEVTADMLAGITEAAVVYIYTLANCNTYAVGYDPVPAAPTVDPTWVSETTTWGEEHFSYIMNTLYNGVSEIKEQFTYEKLTYIPGSGKFKPGTTSGKVRIQLGGSGSPTKQCISFMPAGPGTLSVTALSTGDDDRTLVVSDGTNELGTMAAPNKSATPEAKSLDINVAPGTPIYFYSKSSGLNVLEIKWTVK